MAGHVASRNRPGKVVLLLPAELPELARVTGQAMVLHAIGNGRTLLYVEQNDGARLAIFDVTNPAKIKQEPAAQLDASGSFDFVSSLGDYAELIRYRDGQGEAVLLTVVFRVWDETYVLTGSSKQPHTRPYFHLGTRRTPMD